MRRLMTFTLFAGALLAGGAHSADVGVYGTAGTVGVGGGVAASFGKYVGARVGYTTYSYEADDLERSDLTFDGTADIGGAQALLDLHPFGGGFRLTVGVMESAQVRGRAVPTADTFEFGGVTYSAADVGHARGAADLGSYAPYVGFGFGRALSRDGRFAMSADLGLALTGPADVTLDVSCTAGAAVLCEQLADDVAIEQAELQREADDYDYWPVLSVGVSYRF